MLQPGDELRLAPETPARFRIAAAARRAPPSARRADRAACRARGRRRPCRRVRAAARSGICCRRPRGIAPARHASASRRPGRAPTSAVLAAAAARALHHRRRRPARAASSRRSRLRLRVAAAQPRDVEPEAHLRGDAAEQLAILRRVGLFRPLRPERRARRRAPRSCAEDRHDQRRARAVPAMRSPRPAAAAPATADRPGGCRAARRTSAASSPSPPSSGSGSTAAVADASPGTSRPSRCPLTSIAVHLRMQRLVDLADHQRRRDRPGRSRIGRGCQR